MKSEESEERKGEVKEAKEAEEKRREEKRQQKKSASKPAIHPKDTVRKRRLQVLYPPIRVSFCGSCLDSVWSSALLWCGLARPLLSPTLEEEKRPKPKTLSSFLSTFIFFAKGIRRGDLSAMPYLWQDKD